MVFCGMYLSVKILTKYYLSMRMPGRFVKEYSLFLCALFQTESQILFFCALNKSHLFKKSKVWKKLLKNKNITTIDNATTSIWCTKKKQNYLPVGATIQLQTIFSGNAGDDIVLVLKRIRLPLTDFLKFLF